MSDFEHLEYFVTCYLNEDWDIEGPTLDSVLDVFIAESSPEQIQGVRSDIAAVRAESDKQLAERLADWHLGYAYQAGGMDAHDFLAHIDAHLAR